MEKEINFNKTNNSLNLNHKIFLMKMLIHFKTKIFIN